MKPRKARDFVTRLRDVIEAAESILAMAQGITFAEYASDNKTRWAVERQFIIVGEALMMAAKIDPTLEQKVTAFRQIVDFRNVLVHGYGELEHDVIWTTIIEDVTPLTSEIKAILARDDGQTPA